MGTFTPFLNLFKPDGAPTGDNVNVATDLNANYDKIDTKASDQNTTLTDHESRLDVLEPKVALLEDPTQIGHYNHKWKSVSTVIDFDNTPNNDPHLFFTGLANAKYFVEVVGFWRATDGVPDIRARMDVPSGSWSGGFQALTLDTAGNTANLKAAVEIGAVASSASHGVNNLNTLAIYKYFISLGAAGGTVAFAWSQDNSVASNLTLIAGSHMTYVRVA